ncbi:LPS export ABC transporter periplasmic protein LptC [Saccharospirillum impatiens]|uniref:LPS export ABC transporter periplasmic protein LptC n=1 Tax=Saccharospirillum impatiens TaxID=169438 RepID=UPI000408BDC6|nr:LPS export ABC transporter periplasmic protein LptC [Saccharospirillum impatiens]
MTNRRPSLIIASSLVLIALAIWWQTSRDEITGQARLELPENAPDLYIEQPDQTRFNIEGKPQMRARAESLAYYESKGESLMRLPVMTVLSSPDKPWRITSEQAVLFDDGSINFEQNVEVIEQQTQGGMELYTEWLRVEQNGRFVTTPRPVRLLQPGQEARGIGMDAVLTGDDSDITLKSEVSIRYDAN